MEATTSTLNDAQQRPRLNSISPECDALKHRYDDCFNKWFSEKFLKGHSGPDPCARYLDAYTACVKKAAIEKGVDYASAEELFLGTEKDKSRSHPGGHPPTST